MIPLRQLLLYCAIVLSIHLCAQVSPTPAVTELYQFATEFRADEGSLNRFYTVDKSPERAARLTEFYERSRRELAAFDYGQLSVDARVEYHLINNYLDDKLDRITEEKERVTALAEWLAPAAPIYQLEKERRRGKSPDAARMAGQINNMEAAVREAIRKLESTQTKFTAALARTAGEAITGQRTALESIHEFYAGYAPLYSWYNEKPVAALDAALEAYTDAIREAVDPTTQPPDDGSGIIGQPIGRTELIRQLRQEMIPYTPEELVDIAEQEFAWCDRELLKASREMGFEDDWRAAQEQVKMAFVPAGEQPEAMLELYEQSVAFLKEHDLLSIPPIAEESWRMTMIPPERQRISPFFLGGEVLQISYPTDEMSHEEKLMSMRGNNPHFSRATVHHELIAGHHLQLYMMRRHKPYRFFGTPFWIEGNALYWEMLLWDMDFPRGPEDRIGMLFWRMHRCARIIFSLNYHLGEWTPQQCIDYLVDRVGHERANAEGEVRRSFTGNYGPLYQIAYMVGGLQFRALETELVKSGKMSYREFHDAVLRENSMPVEMLRAILLRTELPKDFETGWRFY